jgi:dienelactone hydrolase
VQPIDAQSLPGPDDMLAGWIESAQGPLFACYHPARGDAPRDVAVLLCDPFGSDRMNLHLCYRALALALSAQGFPVLRVDYRGTGDSAGYPRDADQVAGWLASLDAAADWLLAASGRRRLGAFGALLGGTLACVFAARRSDVTSLALWGAHPNGGTFLREMRAFQAMRKTGAAQLRPSDWQPGDEEAIGFLLTGEAVAALRTLDVGVLRERPVRAAAVFARGLESTERQILEVLRSAGIPVEGPPPAVVEASEMVDARARPPAALIAQLTGWWIDTHPPVSPAPQERPLPPLASRVTLATRRGRSVAEEWVRFGADGGLVGIVTSPCDAKPAGPGVLLVSGGTNHRPGINRNYAEWARDWAERGLMVLRLDIRGLGDSLPLDPDDVARLYRDDTRRDVVEAMDFLERRHGVSAFLCGGLCAGGYQALATALVDPRITGLFLLNPLRFLPAPGGARSDFDRTPLRDTVRSLRSPARWLELVRQGRALERARTHAARLVRRGRSGVEALARRMRRRPAQGASRLARCFLALVDRGCSVLIVFDADEPVREQLEVELAPDRDRLASTGRFRVELVEHTDHIFLPLESQERVGGLVERQLVAWAREPSAS